jgi:hypothetical protein
VPRPRCPPIGGPGRFRASARTAERAGPSMSTEPGWMAAPGVPLCYLGGGAGRGHKQSSMLLSFERPAPAECLSCTRELRAATREGAAGVIASPRSLKTAQKPHQPPSISGG